MNAAGSQTAERRTTAHSYGLPRFQHFAYRRHWLLHVPKHVKYLLVDTEHTDEAHYRYSPSVTTYLQERLLCWTPGKHTILLPRSCTSRLPVHRPRRNYKPGAHASPHGPIPSGFPAPSTRRGTSSTDAVHIAKDSLKVLPKSFRMSPEVTLLGCCCGIRSSKVKKHQPSQAEAAFALRRRVLGSEGDFPKGESSAENE
jgi:hypothetical protein